MKSIIAGFFRNAIGKDNFLTNFSAAFWREGKCEERGTAVVGYIV